MTNNKPEALRIVDDFIAQAQILHPVPQVILAGIDYTGVPVAEVVAHTRLRIEQKVRADLAEREARYSALFDRAEEVRAMRTGG